MTFSLSASLRMEGIPGYCSKKAGVVRKKESKEGNKDKV